MWLYICLMLFFILASCNRGQSKIKLWIGGLILFVLMGFKNSSVGNDTPNYIELFNRLKRMSSVIDPTSRFEKGYQVYNKLLGHFFDNYQVLFIITAAICIGCMLYGISKNSKNWMYSLFLLIGFRFYYFFLSGLRQGIAVSIVFVAYTFLEKKKVIPYIALIVLATTFHFSAFIFIFAWPLSKMKVNQESVTKLLGGICIIYVFFGPLFSWALSKLPVYYSGYLLTDATSTNNVANFIGAIIPGIFLLFAYSINYVRRTNYTNTLLMEEYGVEEYSLSNSNPDMQIFFMLIAGGLSFVATRASILDRMVQYYWIFSICTIPNMIFSIEDDRKRTVWFLVISVFVMAYNVILLIYRPEWNTVVPYKFCW